MADPCDPRLQSRPRATLPPPSNLARKSRNRVPRSPPKSSPRPPVAEGLQDDLEFLNDLAQDAHVDLRLYN